MLIYKIVCISQRIGEKGSPPASTFLLASLLSGKGEMYNIWTKEEAQFLVENAKLGSNYIAKQLNRTVSAVQNKALKLNVSLTDSNKWNKEEEQFLINNYAQQGPSYCAEKLGRTVKSVTVKAARLNLTKSLIKIEWSKQEEEFLLENYAEHGPTYCAEKLNRTYDSVHHKAARLHLQANTNSSNSNIVYIIYFPDLFLYKIGITNCVEKRIKRFGHSCIILKVQEFDPKKAAQLERELLNSVVLINTGLLKEGNTETFTEPSKEIKEFLAKQFAE